MKDLKTNFLSKKRVNKVNKLDKKIKIISILVILVVIILFYFFIYKVYFVKNPLDDFTKCLTNEGVKVYVAESCGPCQAQKQIFQNSWRYLNYTDCTDEQSQKIGGCISVKATNYPTWFIKGRWYAGLETLEILENRTDCKLQEGK